MAMLSLLLAVATVVVWMRQRPVFFDFPVIRNSHSIYGVSYITLSESSVLVAYLINTHPMPDPWGAGDYFDHLGLYFGWYIHWGSKYLYLIIPYWVLVAGFGLMPLHWIWFWRRKVRRQKKRIAAGCCEQCGYDLRASKDRCPECGRGFSRTIAIEV